jgi:hypothetical protein
MPYRLPGGGSFSFRIALGSDQYKRLAEDEVFVLHFFRRPFIARMRAAGISLEWMKAIVRRALDLDDRPSLSVRPAGQQFDSGHQTHPRRETRAGARASR